MKFSKCEAAKRQLNSTIRLYFSDDDLCSTITLSRAAFRLLWDVYPKMVSDGFEKPLSELIEILGWSRFNGVSNFLKHADKDHDQEMEIDDLHAETGIGFGVILYGRITNGNFTPEMKAWETIKSLEQPDIWDAHPDPGHEGYQDFQRGVEIYRKASKEERRALARSFLQMFQRMELN